MNLKNKKIIILVVGIVAGVGIISSSLYTPINAASNEYVEVASILYNIKDSIIRDKKIFLDTQDEMMKLSKDKEKKIQISNIIEEIERTDYTNESKVNDCVKQLDKLNEEIENMIKIYNEDESMKKDISISNAMMDIEGTNSFIDKLMTNYNTKIAPNFNEFLKKFPVNVVAKNKGWFEVDKFLSVN